MAPTPKRRTKKYSVGNVSRRGRVMSISKPIGYRMLTRSMSRQLSTCGLLAKQNSPMIRNCPYFDGDAFRVAEFERNEEQTVKFPPFPTLDEVPVLEVPFFQEDDGPELGQGCGGRVYKARLLNSFDEKHSLYAIKLVDADWRFTHEFAYCLEQLHDEYAHYYLLQDATRNESIARIIRRYTPVCYGLYQFIKDRAQEKFLLITQYVPGQLDNMIYLRKEKERKYHVMEALVCLHSIGLLHCDARGANMLFDDVSDSVKLIDFSESTWHNCPGLPICGELIGAWRLMFCGRHSRPFQESIISRYNLQFINLEEILIGKSKEERERYKKQLGHCLISYLKNSQDEDA